MIIPDPDPVLRRNVMLVAGCLLLAIALATGLSLDACNRSTRYAVNTLVVVSAGAAVAAGLRTLAVAVLEPSHLGLPWYARSGAMLMIVVMIPVNIVALLVFEGIIWDGGDAARGHAPRLVTGSFLVLATELVTLCLLDRPVKRPGTTRRWADAFSAPRFRRYTHRGRRASRAVSAYRGIASGEPVFRRYVPRARRDRREKQ